MDYASIIKQKSEDLQDELKELDRWQDEILRERETNKKRKVHLKNVSAIPPIRGTVASLKEAVSKANGVCNTEEGDPVKKFKEKGNELFQTGKIEGAIEAYSSGIDLDVEGAMAHILYGNRALCNLKLERWEKAEQDASSCLRLNRSYSKGYFRRAMARKQLGNLKGARADLEAVLALSPNDLSATNEMKVITKMLQLERESAMPSVKRKKIFIAEVDDDDDGGVDEGKINEKSTVPNFEGGNKSLEVHEVKQVHREIQELEEAREAHRDLQESRAREAEAKLCQKRRTSVRVEVVEEELKENKKGPNPLTKNESQKPAAGVQEISLTGSTIVSSKVPVSKLTETDRKAKGVVPRTFKASSNWSQESLKAPNSFTEFERVFSDIFGDKDLCCYYISLIPPASLRTLFGNNMTPDILLRLLNSVKQLPGTVAISFLRGLSAVKRVDDISLFFDSSEKKVVEEVMDLIVSCGASQEDVKLFRQKLRAP